MRISRNKKILVTAITVFSISAIGISINALTGAFSLDSMSRDEKYMTDAYIARAGDEIDDAYEDEDDFEDETSPEIPGDEESPDIDAVTSATPETDVSGGEYAAGEETMINQGTSQGVYQGATAFDIESSATPRESQTIPGKPSSQNTSLNQYTQAADVVSSATPKTGSTAVETAPGVQPAPADPAAPSAPGTVPAPGVDVVSSATPKSAPAAAETAPGVQPAPADTAAPGTTPGTVPAPGVDVVSSATPKEPSAGSPTTTPPSSPSSPGSSTGTSAGITSDAAKQIVLDKIPGASITDCELDEDDGILIYEIEAYVGQNKYTFKINANTGAILSYEEDIADTEDAEEADEPDDDGDGED